MAIDLGDIPTGTPPTAGEKLQIRSAIGVGQTDAPTFLAVNFDANTQLTGSGGFLSYKSYGTTALNMGSAGLTLGTSGTNTASITLSNAAGVGAVITTDSPGILAQRNGTAKQVHRVYNTFLGTTANEWGGFDWLTTANTLRIGTEHGGTGAARPIEFVTGGVVRMSIAAAGNVGIGTATPSDRLEIWGNSGQTAAKITSVSPGTGSNFIFSGAFGQVYNEIGDFYITNNATSSSVIIRAGATGAQLRFTPAGLLQLGGTTSAFPAIKRNGTGIDIRLADDSAFAPLATGAITCGGALTMSGPIFGGVGQYIAINQTSVLMWSPSSGVMLLQNAAQNNFNRIQLGGTTSAFPAIKRNGTGIDIVLADDAGFAPVKGKLTTDTAYTATVVAATGYITLYDSTGTAYRVPCAV